MLLLLVLVCTTTSPLVHQSSIQYSSVRLSFSSWKGEAIPTAIAHYVDEEPTPGQTEGMVLHAWTSADVPQNHNAHTLLSLHHIVQQDVQYNEHNRSHKSNLHAVQHREVFDEGYNRLYYIRDCTAVALDGLSLWSLSYAGPHKYYELRRH